CGDRRYGRCRVARVRSRRHRPRIGLDPGARMARRTSAGDPSRAHRAGDPLRSAVCLMVTAATLGWLVPKALMEAETYPALRAASAMQLVFESRLPRGARVQVLDSDNG